MRALSDEFGDRVLLVAGDVVDPVSTQAAVEATVAAFAAQHPPLRLATGTHAVTEIRAALQARLAELDAWENISLEVDSVGAA